eukprot:tig00020944_g16365.t1
MFKSVSVALVQLLNAQKAFGAASAPALPRSTSIPRPLPRSATEPKIEVVQPNETSDHDETILFRAFKQFSTSIKVGIQILPTIKMGGWLRLAGECHLFEIDMNVDFFQELFRHAAKDANMSMSEFREALSIVARRRRVSLSMLLRTTIAPCLKEAVNLERDTEADEIARIEARDFLFGYRGPLYSIFRIYASKDISVDVRAETTAAAERAAERAAAGLGEEWDGTDEIADGEVEALLMPLERFIKAL